MVQMCLKRPQLENGLLKLLNNQLKKENPTGLDLWCTRSPARVVPSEDFHQRQRKQLLYLEAGGVSSFRGEATVF